MRDMPGDNARPARGGPRCVAIVGPFGSGKTSLLEAILERTGAIERAGSVTAGTAVGDASREARAHGMGVELNMATTDYLGDRYCFLDCPGSVEFSFEMEGVLAGADLAIVVCDPDPKRIPALQLVMKRLEELRIPRVLFLNKIDRADASLRETLTLMQAASTQPLVIRQIPIWQNGIAVGTIDLALERAYIYREHAESTVCKIPDDEMAAELAARYEMLERLADYDDHLMEELLGDIAPARDEVHADLGRDMREGLIVPVFLGAALRGNGVTRLLKALRHEAPDVVTTRARLGLDDGAEAIVQVMKTQHVPHTGKLSVVRVLRGNVSDGATLTAPGADLERISGLYRPMGRDLAKNGTASAGEVVVLGKLAAARTGMTLTGGRGAPRQLADLAPPPPVMALAIRAVDLKDEAKLSAALLRLCEEDPALVVTQDPDTGQSLLKGQGEMHLRVALERLSDRFGVSVESGDPAIPYRETIARAVTTRGRHKKQSGGHGQFGDVLLSIAPLPRGEGERFIERITGGVIPRQYIGAVEAGMREVLGQGPLGFRVVDLEVTLLDGSHHTVDSSDQAFRTAAGLAMRDGLPQCAPVLLEPILKVTFSVPSEATARINQIVTGRRGQLLGFDGRDGWPGWDEVQALIPQAEIGRMIVDVRSASSGVGSFAADFDHLSEMAGQQADRIVAHRRVRAA